MAYKYPYQAPRHYNRRRPYKMLDGDRLYDFKVMTTRYTCGYFLKKAKGPRGGRAYKECAHSVYYAKGKFWRAKKLMLENGDWLDTLCPVDCTITDCHWRQSEEQGIPVVYINCDDGVPTEAYEDNVLVWTIDYGVDLLLEVLRIPNP